MTSDVKQIEAVAIKKCSRRTRKRDALATLIANSSRNQIELVSNATPPPVSLPVETIPRDDPRYPARLRERLGANAPGHLSALGNLDFLAHPKTALLGSARCPGDAILRAYDQAAKWRDGGRCIISGFHSPVEKECLRILLRGSQPIIICPTRSLP